MKAEGDETVVFSWIEWASKAARDAAWPKVFADPRMHPGPEEVPYAAQRRIHGGFRTLFDSLA